jgi:hypothetical protein
MIYKREEYIAEDSRDEKFPVKNIEVLTPTDGAKKRFLGQVVLGLQTPMGVQQIPISFDITAETVEEAFQKFEQFAQPEIDHTRRAIEEEINRARQEATSRIIRPGELGLGAGNVIDLGKVKK